jgi:ribosomal protein S18 acetylase RimI-like enzyme
MTIGGDEPEPVARIERVADEDAARRLLLPGLSTYFGPFLHRFAIDTLRSRGEVWVSRSPSGVDGLFLYLEAERTGSIFTRSSAVAGTFASFRPGSSVYTEFRLGREREPYGIFVGPTAARDHRFRHPVRPARESDRVGILSLLTSVYGAVAESWFDRVEREDELGFVVDGHAELAGAGWISLESGIGRLHSLAVRPRYRRLGIGSDLWHARAFAASHAGASALLTEIAELNVPSRRIAEAGGMRRVGAIYRCVA